MFNNWKNKPINSIKKDIKREFEKYDKNFSSFFIRYLIKIINKPNRMYGKTFVKEYIVKSEAIDPIIQTK